MKAIILLNGEPFRGEIDTSGAYVYCVFLGERTR